MTTIAKPLVSLILPIFNEEDILEKNLEIFYQTTEGLKDLYDWEIILVNDGSTDKSEELLKAFAEKYTNVNLFHHSKNQGLGKALQIGFALSSGDYVITYDVDLTYSISYIKILLEEIISKNAAIVMASPYMKGGKVSNVPTHRKVLSVAANKFLSVFAEENISCLTCMVRVYDGDYIRSLNLRSRGKEIMQEIVHKTIIMRGEIIEIPAHLNWDDSGTRVVRPIRKVYFLKHISATFLRGFLLRPVIFFIIPGVLLFLFSLYPNYWMFNHFLTEYHLIESASFLDHCSKALEIAYQKHPHTFHTGLLVLLMSLQFLALGFQSLQHKHSYEELLSLGIRLNERARR